MELIDEPTRVAGYFQLDSTEAAEMFYFYFQNREQNPDAPLAIWLSGGPGCSSEVGLFFELLGPYLVDRETLEVTENPDGWDRAVNLIFVDQPVNVGFSYSTSDEDRVYDEDRVAADMLDFVLEFLEVHPELKGKEIFVTGESYAGHYIPHIAHHMYEYGLEHSMPVKLAGIAIGNGMSSPTIQYSAYSDFALDNDLIDDATYKWIKQWEPTCEELGSVCYRTEDFADCTWADTYCTSSTFNVVMNVNPGMNVYDIRKGCEGPLCYPMEWLSDFLNSEEVQAALGVDRKWIACSRAVGIDFAGDRFLRSDDLIPDLLHAGVRVLIYAGDQDFICNWLGNRRWVDQL